MEGNATQLYAGCVTGRRHPLVLKPANQLPEMYPGIARLDRIPTGLRLPIKRSNLRLQLQASMTDKIVHGRPCVLVEATLQLLSRRATTKNSSRAKLKILYHGVRHL